MTCFEEFEPPAALEAQRHGGDEDRRTHGLWVLPEQRCVNLAQIRCRDSALPANLCQIHATHPVEGAE